MEDILRTSLVISSFSLLAALAMGVLCYEVYKCTPPTPEPTETAKQAEKEIIMMARA